MGKVVPFKKRRKKAKKAGKRQGAPGRGAHVWQAAMVRLPAWVKEDDDGDERPYRPWGGLAVSLRHGLIGVSDTLQAGADTMDAAHSVGQALSRLAETCGEWPTRLELRDPGLAEVLASVPCLAGVEIVHRPRLAALQGVLAEMATDMENEGWRGPPPATSVPGVTADHLRAFATAARRFYEAEPWGELNNADVIRLEGLVPDPHLRHLVVMGAGADEYGLMFQEHAEDFLTLDEETSEEDMLSRTLWSVTFWEPPELHFSEHDLWEDEGLPVVEGWLIPAAVCFGPKRRLRRASPRVLAFLEGVLSALAETTPAELDAGAWRRTVVTSQGEVTVGLALVEVEEPSRKEEDDDDLPPMPSRFFMERHLLEVGKLLEGKEFEGTEQVQAFLDQALAEGHTSQRPTSDRDRAQELAFQAMETPGRRRRALARQALELWPDCADALSVLAEDTRDLDAAIELFEQAVAAGERAIGPEVFADDDAPFWAMTRSRPYMRARLSLAQCLWLSGRRREAVQHYRELLRLNPNDNQGVRTFLAGALIELVELDEAEELLTAYKEPEVAMWQYPWALVTFLKHGDGRLARRRLTEAFKSNPYVPELLLGLVPLPAAQPSHYRLGEESEAVACVGHLGAAWEASEGAPEWLAERWDRFQ